MKVATRTATEPVLGLVSHLRLFGIFRNTPGTRLDRDHELFTRKLMARTLVLAAAVSLAFAGALAAEPAAKSNDAQIANIA